MKKCSLVECVGGSILDHQRTGGEGTQEIAGGESASRQKPGAALAGPQSGQMTLAGALRPDQSHGAIGPVGPALDQSDPRDVRGAAQEVFAREAFRMVEGERELARMTTNRRHAHVPAPAISIRLPAAPIRAGRSVRSCDEPRPRDKRRSTAASRALPARSTPGLRDRDEVRCRATRAQRLPAEFARAY